MKLHGLANLGARESDAGIEAFAVRAIGIPRPEWKMVDSGTGQRGFALPDGHKADYMKWYESIRLD